MPRVRSELQTLHPGLQLEKQLDASEAFAMGAGLHAANLSTTFRLRKFGMLDVLPHAVAVSLEPGPGVPDSLSVRMHSDAQLLLSAFDMCAMLCSVLCGMLSLA